MATTSAQVFINSDMGEAFGLHSFGNDERLMPIIDAANVACGFHAGDPSVMRATVELAREHGVRVGSHPGLPDLAGFGRRRMTLTPDEVEDVMLYQTGALVAYLQRVDMPLAHIKPHGALWGMLAADETLMRAAARVVRLYDVPFFGLAGTFHESVCAAEGIDFVGELYVDMDYNPDGTLHLSRAAHVTDPAAAAQRVRDALSSGTITAIDGTAISVRFNSVCVHSDAHNSPAVAAAVRDTLNAIPANQH